MGFYLKVEWIYLGVEGGDRTDRVRKSMSHSRLHSTKFYYFQFCGYVSFLLSLIWSRQIRGQINYFQEPYQPNKVHTRYRPEVTENTSGEFVARTDFLPYISRTPVFGHFLPVTSTSGSWLTLDHRVVVRSTFFMVSGPHILWSIWKFFEEVPLMRTSVMRWR